MTLCVWRWVAYGTLSSTYSSWWALRHSVRVRQAVGILTTRDCETRRHWYFLHSSFWRSGLPSCSGMTLPLGKETGLEHWCFTARSLSLAVRFGRFWLPDESWLNLEYHYVVCLEFCSLRLFRIGLNCSVYHCFNIWIHLAYLPHLPSAAWHKDPHLGLLIASGEVSTSEYTR